MLLVVRKILLITGPLNANENPIIRNFDYQKLPGIGNTKGIMTIKFHVEMWDEHVDRERIDDENGREVAERTTVTYDWFENSNLIDSDNIKENSSVFLSQYYCSNDVNEV